MAKREEASDGPDRAATGDERTVYFDTSLGTHLVFTISDSDTVADTRKRIVHEHLKCFPALGKIMINALKVHRKEYFYHLSDSMPVRCAFEGVMESWFLYVDASSLKRQDSLEYLSLNPTSNEKGIFKQPKNDLANSAKEGKNDVKKGLICAKERPCQSSSSYSTLRSGNLGTLGKDVDCKEDDSKNKIGYVQFNSLEEALKHSPCKKKQRRRSGKVLKEHNIKAGVVQTSHLQEVTENENALIIYDGSNKEAGAEFVAEENRLCIVPLNIEQQKIHSSTGMDTNEIASALANGKSNTSEVGASNGSKKSKHTKKQQSRDQRIHASPAFHDSINADKHGAEIGSEDKDLTDDKNKKKRKLPSDHDISTQVATDRQNSEVIGKDFVNSTRDERPKKRSKKVGTELQIRKPMGVKELEKTTSEQKEKVKVKKSVYGKPCASVIVNDNLQTESSLPDHTDKNEKDHKIMPSEEIGPEMMIEKSVGVKELENIASEQRKKVKAKKSIKPGTSVTVNDNFQTESSLPNHTDKNEKDHNIMQSEEIGLEMEIGKTVGVVKVLKNTAEQRKKVKVKKSVKPGTSVMVNDNLQTKSSLPDHTDNKNEKNHNIMPFEEVDPELQIEKTVEVKELENTTNEQRQKVKVNKSVRPRTSAMVNDNLQTKSSLPDHTDNKNEKNHNIMPFEEVDPKLQIEKTVEVKELENTTDEQRQKVKVNKSVRPRTSAMVNDNLQTESSLPDHTDNKNEKNHNIMPFEEVDPELQIEKLVEVKELENTTNEQRQKVKVNKSVRPHTSAMVNDNLQTESSLPDHTKKNEKDHKIMSSQEVGPEMQIKKAVGVKELENVASVQRKDVKVKKSIKSGTSLMVNDNFQTESFLPNHTDKNEEQKIMPSNKVGPETQIGKLVGVKELENAVSEKKKKVKVKKSVKLGTSVMVNGNLQTESSLPNHTDKYEKDQSMMISEEVGSELHTGKVVEVKKLDNTACDQRNKVISKKSIKVKPGGSAMVNDNDHTNKTYEKDDHDRQVKELDFAEVNDTNEVRESVLDVKSNTEKTKRKRSNKFVTVKPATTNVNACNDVSATNYKSKSDERRELPDDDEVMLSERKEEESCMASQVTEAPEENPKDSEDLVKVNRMQTPMVKTSLDVNLKEQSPIDCIANNAGIKDEKMGKKMKKNKVINVKRHPDLPFEEKEIASQEFNPQPDTLVQEEASDSKKNSKSLKSDPKNQLAGGVLEEDTNSTTADLTSILPDTAIYSNPKSESNSLNFKEFSVSRQVVDKVSEASRSSDRPEVTKGKKISSIGLSSSNIQFQGPSSKVDTKPMSKSISESRKLHQIKSASEEAGRTNSNSLEMRTPALASRKKNTESSRVPIWRPETSEIHMKNLEKSNMKASHNQDLEVSKASRNKIGEKIINSSQNKNSLLARSGSIFWDASSESSKDDNGEKTSDSSSKSPSDSSSSSSGYSAASNLRSNVAESFGTKGKESGKKNTSEPRSPASKRPNLDMILKSSSRFKKARLTAIESKHEEDSESKPVEEFVPESEP